MFPTTDLRLRAYVQVLVRHRLAIVLTAFVVVVVGTAPSLLAEPVYASTASMRVKAENTDSPFMDEQDQPNAQTRSRDLVTDVEVIESARMRSLVVDRLGPEAEPFGSVTATLVGFSEIIEVRVQAMSPSAAADAANAYAEVFVEDRQEESVEAIEAQSAELRRRIQAATEQIAALDSQLVDPETDPVIAENLRVNRATLASQVLEFSTRADELDVEAALLKGGTEIVTRAELNLTPVSPKPLRAGVTAAVLGMLAGVAVGVLLDVAQDRLTDVDELATVDPAVPVLGSIPHFASQSDGTPEPAAREAYKFVRTSLRFQKLDRPVRSIVVTSATSSEGKTTTSVNLAASMAENGSRVVLLDADLRRPAVHEQLGLPMAPGLADVLAGEASFNDAVRYVAPNLAVVPSGATSPAAAELLGREDFGGLIRSLVAQSDVVLIDSPPVLPVADALVLGRSVDATLVVARLGVVRRRELRTLARQFRDAGLPLVGFVANDATDGLQYGDYASYGPDDETSR